MSCSNESNEIFLLNPFQKEDTRANKASELSLANVGGVFVVLLAGMGLACLIAVFEFIWKSRKLASSENVRHSSLVAKALSHTNENMFYVPRRLDRQLVVNNAPVAIAMALAAAGGATYPVDQSNPISSHGSHGATNISALCPPPPPPTFGVYSGACHQNHRSNGIPSVNQLNNQRK